MFLAKEFPFLREGGFSYPSFARYVVTRRVGGSEIPEASELLFLLEKDYPELGMPQACFVSIKRGDGNLRGCMGTLSPCYAYLIEELIENAQAAAFRDPRFSPVRERELPSLRFSCDLLETPQETNFQFLDPKTLGVIVSWNGMRGVLLPNLDGIETPQEQVEIAMRKAGISGIPFEKLHLMSFRVQRYEEF